MSDNKDKRKPIGLKDKNGKDICEGDTLKIKMTYYEKPFEAYYKVEPITYKGLSMRLIGLITPDWTLHTSLSWKYGQLGVAHRSESYDKLAVHNTWGSNHLRPKEQWPEQEYSEDIEIRNDYKPVERKTL